MSKFSPEKFRFGVYRAAYAGAFVVPVSVHDTSDSALDAARILLEKFIENSDTVGSPNELAVFVLPVPRGNI